MKIYIKFDDCKCCGLTREKLYLGDHPEGSLFVPGPYVDLEEALEDLGDESASVVDEKGDEVTCCQLSEIGGKLRAMVALGTVNNTLNPELCQNVATVRFTWPGENERAVCVDCGRKIAGIAAAIGLQLQFLSVTEGGQCSQIEMAKKETRENG